MDKLIIECPKIKDHEDSFWYDGVIARKGKYILVATGEIKVMFPGEQDWCSGKALQEAYARGYTDKDLEKMTWDNNNWFEVISDDGECDIGVVEYTYDEAIKMLERYYEEDIYETRKEQAKA